MRMFRAWLADHPEPSDFPLAAPCSCMAAADMVRSMDACDFDALESSPLAVLTRDESGRVERSLVRAEKTVHVWGEPDAPDAPSSGLSDSQP